MTTVAALYVATGGTYFGLPDVEPYDIHRDARKYAGPWSVVAHPPCGPWGVFARQCWTHRALGDDDGCFLSALEAVRRWGGVIEHPACSSAWKWHKLIQPHLGGGWVSAGDGGWTCTVDQGRYGHKSRKPTWLYAHGVELPSLHWGKSSPPGNYNNMSTKQRTATPPNSVTCFSELPEPPTTRNSPEPNAGRKWPRGASMITIRPLTLEGANDAVRLWHRHHKPVRSHKFSIAAEVDGALAGVVIVGRPVAQALDDGYTAEVTRLATPPGAVPHVASKLLGAARRAAIAMGYRRIVSYTREDEPGTCYRAAGWHPVAKVKGREWTGGNKSTRWLPGMYEPTTEIVDRVRWEAA